MARTDRLIRLTSQEIRRRRETKGISQEALANICGLHRTYVGAIERGERNVTITTLLKIADALDCEISDLVPQRQLVDEVTMDRRLGDLKSSEQLIFDLYVNLRKRINEWAAVTKQTAQARMGYVGQHLVSVATGYPGGRSGARGKDLIMGESQYGEIKTCYRVDQLGQCERCGAVVSAIEQECPKCGSSSIQRKDDSKWLISVRNEEEYALLLEPNAYFLVLFDFTDLDNPHTIRSSIWEVSPKRPGFAFCMIDYFENIRKQSQSKAPFNLWPFQFKFHLMCPRLIYRSFISKNDTVTTTIFPSRDEPEAISEFSISPYSRATSLTLPKLTAFAKRLGLESDDSESKLAIIQEVNEAVAKSDISPENALDILAYYIYWPGIDDKFNTLPDNLKGELSRILRRVLPSSG